MKIQNVKPSFLVAIALLLTSNLMSCSKTEDESIYPGNDPATNGLEKDALAASDEEALLFMREEEKLARDVYTYLDGLYELPVFGNITKSEQQHMDKVLSLLEYYGLEDPASPNYGEFTNEELQELYNTLINLGEQSLGDALQVGATIEEVDIVDLQASIDGSEDEYLQCVFGNLMRASRNHLRAFYRQLEMRDIIYEPQYLDQETFNTIITGPHEAGGTPCFP
jgi:hypothetical protein